MALNKYQNVINCAVTLVSGVGKFDHISPVLESLHWLPVDYRIEFKVLCLACKSLHGLAPSYLADLVKPYATRCTLYSTNQNLLIVSKTMIPCLRVCCPSPL